MKITRTVAAGILLAWMCPRALASPPLDRPSPPPCCADGQCFANPLTYGWYEVRWRRWPMESCMVQVAPGKTARPTVKPIDDVPPFERPDKNKEDSRAPAPTAPPTESQQGNGTQPGGPGGARGPAGSQPGGATPGPGGPTGTSPGSTGFQPRTGSTYSPSSPTFPPSQPLTPPQNTPSTSPQSMPGGQGTQPSDSPLFKNVPQNSPLNKAMPTGDLDPPPTLPFGPQSIGPEQPVREASRPATTPISGPVTSPEQPPSNDPPPAPPVALVSSAE